MGQESGRICDFCSSYCHLTSPWIHILRELQPEESSVGHLDSLTCSSVSSLPLHRHACAEEIFIKHYLSNLSALCTYVLYLHFAHVFLVVKDLHPETEYFDFYLIDYWLIEREKGRTFAKLKSTYIVWEFTLHESYNSLKVLPGGFWLVASVLTSVRPNLRRKITPLHNVYFVKYDVTVSFMSQVLDTVTYFVP